MTIYNVHIYREMRLYFPGIDAASAEEAARIAADKLTDEAEIIEDCDGENLAALVDLAGDDEFTQSVAIDFEPERQRKAVLELLEALELFLQFNNEWLVATDAQADPEHDRVMRIARAAITKATALHPAERQP
ncbi:MAG TPA: hypothetical protein PKC45_04355 [Gemmatales bacterium]|nr:hypothetical protein [Gemmatales bacterium]